VPAKAQQTQKPNIILIVADDFGYGDSGPYGGGEGRGMPTPNIDRLSNEGMTFFDFYAQPSCTPGRAAIMTGRIPNRSGMTTNATTGVRPCIPTRGTKIPDLAPAVEPSTPQAGAVLGNSQPAANRGGLTSERRRSFPMPWAVAGRATSATC
jgi:hypothetical protein